MSSNPLYIYTLRITQRDGSIVQKRIVASNDLRALNALYMNHRQEITQIKSISLGDPVPKSKSERQKKIKRKKAQQARRKKEAESKYWIYNGTKLIKAPDDDYLEEE